MTPDRSRYLTLASAGCSLAKIATVVDGAVCATTDPRWPRLYTFTPVEITDPQDLLDVLSTAAEERIAPCVVRAEPKAEVGRRAIYDDPEKGPAALFVVPRAWVGFDIEKVPNKAGLDPLRDGAAIAAYVQFCLPPAFRRATVVWQLTASAGKRLNELRCHLWYMLDKPLDGRQLKAWCEPGIKQGLLDPCTVTNAVLPHFIAVKIMDGHPDPCPQRWGIVPGEYDFVPVPGSIVAAAEQPRPRPFSPAGQGAAFGSTEGGNLDALRAAYGPRLEARRHRAAREIRDQIEIVRRSGAGARHPSYLRASATIAGICRYWCIPTERPRADLEEAYLSTLTADEARSRERGSTRGVWDWLDRRPQPANDDSTLPGEKLAKALRQGGGR